MIVTLDTELWLHFNHDGTRTLSLPLARRLDGSSVPGVVTPRPTVLPVGTEIELRVYIDGCRGCEVLRKHETHNSEPVYVEHTHRLLG